MAKRANETGLISDIDAILAQREELKRRDPEAILLFRVNDSQIGDGYRIIGEDAQLAYDAIGAKGWLDLVFVMTKTGIILSVGDLERFLDRIVKAGKRAAVIEQVKRPAWRRRS